MRLHTDTTLSILDDSTTVLGRTLRHFVTVTCPAFNTKETQAEYQARKRAQARSARLRSGATADSAVAANTAATVNAAVATSSDGRRPRIFNMKVIKLHFLGDYVAFIRLKGTTDSYSTQTVCLPCHACGSC